jgi:mono/diheme cytochrome c family protein
MLPKIAMALCIFCAPPGVLAVGFWLGPATVSDIPGQYRTAAAGGESIADEAAAAGVSIDLLDPDNISAGDELFHATCSAPYCHGKNGTQRRSRSLRDRPDLTVSRVLRTIIKGRKRAGKVMPAWGNKLEPEDIELLVAYIVSLRNAGPVDGSATGD